MREIQRTSRAESEQGYSQNPPESADAAARVPTGEGSRADGKASGQPGELTAFIGRSFDNAQDLEYAEAVTLAQATELFKDEDSAYLMRCAVAGWLRQIQLNRDEFVPSTPNWLLVCQGQLALGRFRAKAFVTQNEREPASAGVSLTDKPLAAQATRLLAAFAVGAVLDVAETLQAREPSEHGEVEERALFTLTPAVLLELSPALLKTAQREAPTLVKRLKEAATRAMDASNEPPRKVTDFFIRHGLSVATRLRVIDLAQCTACGDCERACATRYGQPRLRLNGPVLGPYAFAETCRTCSDARCLSACTYDAIKWDTSEKEVHIDPEKCTGCSLCSWACPYGAITMRERAPTVRGGTGRTALVTYRQASKCDHCAEYHGEQACISACQKDALFEVSPVDLFLRTHQGKNDRAFSSQDTVDGVLRLQTELPPDPAPALGAPSRPRNGFLLGVGSALVAWAALEVGVHAWLGRYPLLSLFYALRGSEPPQEYAWSGGLTHWLAILGLALMLAALLYVPLQRLPWLRRVSAVVAPPVTRWARLRRVLGSMEVHAAVGLLGPLLIGLHALGSSPTGSAGRAAAWLLAVVLLVGWAARRASGRISRAAVRAAHQAERLSQELNALQVPRGSLAPGFRWIMQETERLRVGLSLWDGTSIHASPSVWSAVFATRMLIESRLRRETAQLLRHLSVIPDSADRLRAARLLARLSRARRQELLLPYLQPIGRTARLLHIVGVILLALLVALHIRQPWAL